MYAILEKLPIVAEYVQAIIHHAPSYGVKKEDASICSANSQILWQKASGQISPCYPLWCERQIRLQVETVYHQSANIIKWNNKCNMLFDILGKDADP